MKDLSFISNTNGLVVTAPADAFPNPNCGKVMCPIRGASDPEEPGFTCTPQLDQLEGAVIFSVVPTEGSGEDPTMGAVYNSGGEGGWTQGDGPDGAPVGTDEFNLYNESSDFIVLYTDAQTYESVTVSVFDSEGNALVEDESMVEGGGEWTFQSDGVALEADATYCVVMTFTPVEP